MILNLGGFLFETRHAVSIEMSATSGIASNERINNNIAHYRANLGRTNLSLAGRTLPNSGDGNKKLKKLWQLMREAKPLSLVAGDGKYYGKFVILEIKETRSIWTNDAKFLAQEFTINLEQNYDR
ncbi:phage P2 GpU family protein [Campylobacter hyointestinalis subsp. lawsonii CCUG 27631]|uniref:phage tail protein n=1 Tax=Campylobacter hyointestinalis TaxID=198 RepID=UPI0007C95D27|nr:phage tail protein [Campylobacter hyointestinalis]ANE33768.1 phage P2 GpU family protein [Campylobacter hyointestinalis subsp. lawsonii CCUG 27631]